MSNGDYPLGARDNSSAPYNQHEYTRHVVVTIETDITVESPLSMNLEELYGRIKEIVRDEIEASRIDYDITNISIS